MKKVLFVLLRSLEKFKYYTDKKWIFQEKHGSGGHPEFLLQKCFNEQELGQYALCFFDIDKMEEEIRSRKIKNINSGIKKEQKKLEKIALEKKVIIIWQDKKLEDELIRVMGGKYRNISKWKLLRIAIKNKEKFINTAYYNRILDALKKLEKI